MSLEKNQNIENTTKENPVSVEPKLKAAEPVAEVVEVAENDKQTENLAEPIADSPAPAEIKKSAEIVEPTTESPIIETAESEQKPSQPTESPEQKVEKMLQAENLPPVEIPKVEPVKIVQTQEIKDSGLLRELAETGEKEILQQPQTKIVEKIIYKTDPNFIQKLLIKARAKIQERKRKKLEKIMSLFKAKSQIRNGDVRKSLFVKKRTATNYLNQLEREQKIIQVGKKGNEVFYIKKP